MIRLAETLESLSAPCANSPFGCQIWSKAQAYGFSVPFAQFWTDGAAAYGKTDGGVSIAGKITDAEEARAFLRVIGAKEIVCDAENAEKLRLRVTNGGVILQKTLQNRTPDAPQEISPRAVYNVLLANRMAGEFEPFYLDVSHRMRHGTMCCAGIFDGEAAAAAAVAVRGENESLISAVGVLPELQRRGFGTRVLEKTERMLQSGTVYILREENKNKAFYQKAGYAPCGAWRQGTL